MKYAVKTEKEIAEMNNWPDGEYPFTIANAADDVSKTSKREMIVLDIHVFNTAGARKEITDYLVPGTNFGDRKIFEACRAIGLGDKYASGELSAIDFVDKSGFVKVGIQKGKPKETGEGDWPDKNVIKFYITKKAGETTGTPKSQPTDEQLANTTQGEADSDVPF